MTTLHIDRTTTNKSCHIHGWQYWRTELRGLAKRRFGLTLTNFELFDCREYDSYERARQALIEMYKSKLYTPEFVEPTYTLTNVNTNEVVSGTVKQLMVRFNYKQPHSIDRLIREGVGVGRLKDWRVS